MGAWYGMLYGMEFRTIPHTKPSYHTIFYSIPTNHTGNAKIPTCAVDWVDTVQNACELQLTVNDTSEKAVDRNYTDVDRLG